MVWKELNNYFFLKREGVSSLLVMNSEHNIFEEGSILLSSG
jgi:hypothetical protein